MHYLLLMLKQKKEKDNNSVFLLNSFQILIETMKHLLTEMGLAARFSQQITKLESKAELAKADGGQSLTLERVLIIAVRTRKLFTVRDDLISIFSLVVKFELQVPKIRQFLLNSLTYQQNNQNEEDNAKVE